MGGLDSILLAPVLGLEVKGRWLTSFDIMDGEVLVLEGIVETGGGLLQSGKLRPLFVL